MAQSFADQLSDFAHGLLNLEIDTIIKDGMTARKMPVLPHALLDIVEKYVDFFGKIGLMLDGIRAMGAESRPGWVAVFGERGTYASSEVDNSCDTFDWLRWAAAAALKPQAKPYLDAAGQEAADEWRIILTRIRRNCDQLKPVAARLAGSGAWGKYVGPGKTRKVLVEAMEQVSALPPVSPSHTVLVRKIWDIGDEIVEMQTVIQLDGDVITRIRAGLSPEGRAALLPLHQQSIDVSVKHWSTMFSLIGALIGSLLDRIFPATAGK